MLAYYLSQCVGKNCQTDFLYTILLLKSYSCFESAQFSCWCWWFDECGTTEFMASRTRLKTNKVVVVCVVGVVCTNFLCSCHQMQQIY